MPFSSVSISGRRTITFSFIRDWLRLGLMLLAYRETGWFALPHAHHLLESHWVILDFLRGSLARPGNGAGRICSGPD